MTVSEATALPTRRSVLRYLTSRGRIAKSSKDGRRTKLTLPADDGDDELELFFTSTDDPRVSDSEISAALRTIAQLYDIPPAVAPEAVEALSFDLIVGRIPDEYVRGDSVELGLAADYITGMRTFLAASATTEIAGASSFKRLRKEAIEYSERCRFAHTFRGSFGFVIESPVGLNDDPSIPVVEEIVPFERKVVERILRGFRSFERAARSEDAGAIIGEPKGLSANMCDDIVGVVEDSDVSKIEISLQLSPEWRSSLVTDAKEVFSVERRYLDLLKEASSRLRMKEAASNETVVGRVVRLEAEGNPSDLLADVSDREVVVSWDSSDYGLIRVQAQLSPQGYLDAVEAHRQGALVALSGTLQRRGRSWSLTGPSNNPLGVRIVNYEDTPRSGDMTSN
jgi:hypothetical protein